MLHMLIAVQGARGWLGGTDVVGVEEDATNLMSLVGGDGIS